MSDNPPRMDYRQHRRARRLVHECCNYDDGNCLLLDDGEPVSYTHLDVYKRQLLSNSFFLVTIAQ